MSQVSAAGGDTAIIPAPFSNSLVSDSSSNRAQLLIGTAEGSHSEAPLWTQPIPTGSARRVGDIATAGAATWSPDGQSLLFSKPGVLCIAQADGTDARTLTRVTGTPPFAEFSPDGRQIRFTNFEKETSTSLIWEVQADGTRPHKLWPRCCGRWSADGRYYFDVMLSSSGVDIFAAAEDRGLFRRSE